MVRTLQPVLEALDPEVEEAAASLGASRLQSVLRVVLPAIAPAWLTGFALAFARALGEYGSVVFISGNMPMKTEIAPLVIMTKLEQYDYAGRHRHRRDPARGVLPPPRRDQPAPGLERAPRGGGVGRWPAPPPSPRAVRLLLIAVALAFLALFLVVPLVVVFQQALEKGLSAYLAAIREPDALSALRLTLLTAAIAVPANLLFGLAASWAIARFDFPGRSFLLTLIDLPFAISPVISGVVFVLLFGRQGWLGPWLAAHDVKVVFAVPGIVLATVFVTFPFVARELIPVMQAQGRDEEEAAVVLGASGWQIFWRVTLPNVKWGLLYGVILCNARAMGEFGAVSVVSGHIRGLTNTLPLHVEILYNEYQFQAAFAVASLLALLAIVTLVAKSVVEWRETRGGRPSRRAAAARSREWSRRMSIEVRGVTKTFGVVHRGERRQPEGPRRRARGPARPLRLGQDEPAAHHRRARAAGPRPGPLRGPGRDAPRREGPPRRASSSSTTPSSAT